MPDYLPEADARFATWVDQFDGYVDAHAGSLPIDPAQRAALSAAAAAFATAREASEAARVALRVALEGKDQARQTCEEVVRSLVRQVRADPAIVDAQLVAMGIPPRRPTRHRVPLPTVPPVPQVREVRPLRHLLAVVPEPGRRGAARPEGTVGAEVWGRVGDAFATADEGFAYLGLATDGTFVAEYTGADRGRQAEYRTRWLSARGEPGRFGPTASATIAA